MEYQYDYDKARKHLIEMRRKVVAQKGGISVEGLSPLDIEKEKKKTSAKSSKTQEIN